MVSPSRTSNSAAFLAWAEPSLILVSCGVENRHHHPSHGPFLSGRDTVPLVRTDLRGSVAVRWDETGFASWRSARGTRGWRRLQSWPP